MAYKTDTFALFRIYLDAVHFSFVLGCHAFRQLFPFKETAMLLTVE